MSGRILDRLPRVEGILSVVSDPNQVVKRVALESGRSTLMESRLEGKYPLEAIQLTQALSSKSCVAHAIAAASAIENYLQLDPTSAAERVRMVMIRLSSIYSHLHHFYIELLPDYLNQDHFSGDFKQYLKFFISYFPRKRTNGDLSATIGRKILSNLPKVAESLNQLQKTIAVLGGKFPIVMNIIPGGISNFKIEPANIMGIIRGLESIKSFVESEWPEDVKTFIGAATETGEVLEKRLNMLSFGSQSSSILNDQYSLYSEGVWINGKLEPVNELKITESYENTYYRPFNKLFDDQNQLEQISDLGGKTWIKGARYNGEPVLTGALARMFVTHFGGGNMEISDLTGQLVDDLAITFESPNCVASRLLAEIFEGRLYLKSVISALLDFKFDQPLNRNTDFNFDGMGAGIGKVEAPNGALLHQIYVEKGKIAKYRIVSATNWNFSPMDRNGKTGVVETDLNVLDTKEELNETRALRLIHSYNAQIIDGTK